jgi:hypothetical protein
MHFPVIPREDYRGRSGNGDWPGRIPAGRKSNEIVHVTDWFTTLLTMAGLPVPDDRVIDGVDQSSFLYGRQERSAAQSRLPQPHARSLGPPRCPDLDSSGLPSG